MTRVSFPTMTTTSDSVSAFLDRLVAAGCADAALAPDDALRLLSDEIPLLPLVQAAGVVRRHFHGLRVQVHQLNNVQSGACPEDCGYCGQSRDSTAPIQPYRLKPREEIIAEAQTARDNGAYRYCMVLSGRGPSDADIEHMAECIREVKAQFGLETCLSAGLMSDDQVRRLKEAGLDRINHNLNTSRRHYPEICSTHTYQDRIDTLSAARRAGLSLCSGLIVGMGESHADLLDVAFELRSLRAESIPVNFLVPIEGNPVTDAGLDGRPLTPQRVLRVLCLFRFANPTAEVRIGAGREGHLRSLQALALEPANSLFVNGYLLTRGSDTFETIRMIVDAGFEVVITGDDWPAEVRRLIEETRTGGAAAFAYGTSAASVLREDKISPRKLAKMSVNGQSLTES